MKQFFTTVAAALTANLVTIAVGVVLLIVIAVGFAASAGTRTAVEVRPGSILVIDLEQPLADQAARSESRGLFDDALTTGVSPLPLRSATVAIRAAADDDRIGGILLRGTVLSDGVSSGYAALREMRAALEDFKASKKPVLAYLVTPDVRTYYVASAADSITLDPFGSLLFPGMASEQVFLSGLFEKYGIGVQVSRVGRFKAAVEPFTRSDMSPENRLQVASYLGDMWAEVKRGVADSRQVDTVALQLQADTHGILLPSDAQDAKLVDRVGYFDTVLDDLQRIVNTATGDTAQGTDSTGRSRESSRDSEIATLLERPRLPQITLDAYAPLAMSTARMPSASQVVAVVYAQGDIVDGEGAEGQIGGEALSRELRKVRNDAKVKSLVLRVNSPGGSVIASERIQRELALINAKKPVVVSMGSLAASGGYWISTASRQIFAEPNTITGSIGVFAIVPNVKGLANRHGVTFDTVKTGRYADILTLSRPRTEAELAVLQRGTDAVYDAFIARVAQSRRLPVDSVRAIAEGRVWSGAQALRLGLVDSLGGLDAALRTAARLARITGDYDVREYPRVKTPTERFTEFFEGSPSPVAARVSKAVTGLSTQGAAGELARDVVRELSLLSSYNDPRGLYARLPFILRIR
ncbi:MAG TPA: signal peptide peptidase SppA [Gemmatimonas aurantiaca]|uniref:Protease IV n=2 Tax=Gemmatimonas aurantiaca TaxID=173480 RepID=C1A9Z0_GEMAT|nr:signal peptide peptidase SppA [Gemmatimonas aurantiaca]BAH39588.1 protease IV [Gemmatimonas aurantiaca T-27]HCT58402.1 signal peptide peptidase SppA [Gemmatimonas aurantiaca]